MILILLLLCSSVCAAAAGNKVKLQDVQTLTFQHGKLTSGRRAPPVPQLECRGRLCSDVQTLDSAQCYNRGSDGYDVQWECIADVPHSYRFGSTEVQCEGYSYAEDPYILIGSCQLIYSLKHDSYPYDRSSEVSRPSFIRLILLGIVAWLIFKVLFGGRSVSNVSTSGTDHGNGGNGGRGFFGFSGFSSPNVTDGSRSSNRDNSSCGMSRSPNESAGNGNFWLGLLSGAALGLFASSNLNTRRRSNSDHIQSSTSVGRRSSQRSYASTSRR